MVICFFPDHGIVLFHQRRLGSFGSRGGGSGGTWCQVAAMAVTFRQAGGISLPDRG
jgi:hypothetical protein